MYSVDYDATGNFVPFSHPKMGVQYSGQISFQGSSGGLKSLKSTNWFYHIWFWTCEVDDPFTIFSIHRCSGEGTVLDEMTANLSPFFSLGTNGDGNIYLELRTWDSNFDGDVMNKVVATTTRVRKGWNYVAIHVDEIYRYTFVTIYHRSEEHSGAQPYDIYETTLPGVFRIG